MLSTLLDIIIFFDLQLEKAPYSMCVTDVGIVKVSPLYSVKAFVLIQVIVGFKNSISKEEETGLHH